MPSCSICPGPYCVTRYHEASESVRDYLRERVQLILAAPAIPAPGPKRQFVTRRPEDSVAVDVKPPKEPKPKSAAATAKPYARVGISAREIFARQLAGESMAAIAKEFGCGRAALAMKISKERRRSAEFAAAYQKSQECPEPGCGRAKLPSNPHCHICETRAKLAKGRAA